MGWRVDRLRLDSFASIEGQSERRAIRLRLDKSSRAVLDGWMGVFDNGVPIAGSLLETFPIRIAIRPFALAEKDRKAVDLSQALEDDEPAYVRKRKEITQDPWAASFAEPFFESTEMISHLLATSRVDLHRRGQFGESLQADDLEEEKNGWT